MTYEERVRQAWANSGEEPLPLALAAIPDDADDEELRARVTCAVIDEAVRTDNAIAEFIDAIRPQA